MAGACRRALILTHTHAGVQAVRSRLKKLEIPYGRVNVDTFAGWCMRYAHAFSGTAHPPASLPQGQEWEMLYKGTVLALNVQAVKSVVESSYDRILIDEYQDCDANQHEVALALSRIVPTTVFGDPMQGIFEFAGASLDWPTVVYPSFPLVAELITPYRWKKTNPALGAWIGETRDNLIAGREIDLGDERVQWIESGDTFDMGVFFDDFDQEATSVAAIHCRKQMCINLAKATSGAFQAIEELAANRLMVFANDWDAAKLNKMYDDVVRHLFRDCFRQKENTDDEFEEDQIAVDELMQGLAEQLKGANPTEAAVQLLYAARSHPRWKLFRSELWRDCERAITELANGRCSTMSEGADTVRKRSNHIGRHLPKRTISTPLLLKGLEFNDVIIPNAAHFNSEDRAQAKLFYVAISRATSSLTISAPGSKLVFPKPFPSNLVG